VDKPLTDQPEDDVAVVRAVYDFINGVNPDGASPADPEITVYQSEELPWGGSGLLQSQQPPRKDEGFRLMGLGEVHPVGACHVVQDDLARMQVDLAGALLESGDAPALQSYDHVLAVAPGDQARVAHAAQAIAFHRGDPQTPQLGGTDGARVHIFGDDNVDGGECPGQGFTPVRRPLTDRHRIRGVEAARVVLVFRQP